MKTILIATDFSEASRNASFYGVELAKELSARIILFNAFTIPEPKSPLHVSPYRFEVEMEINNRLLDQSFFLDHRCRLIEIMCREGLAEDTILKIAKEKNADFIVVGMNGSGLAPTFGNTVSALAKKTNIPLIIVPEKALFESQNIMLFTSDMPEIDKNMAEPIKAIMQLFPSKLYVTNVIKNNKEACYELEDSGKTSCKTVQTLNACSFMHGQQLVPDLNKTIKENYAEILVVKPCRNGSLEKLFTEEVANKDKAAFNIPILLLPPTECEEKHPVIYANILNKAIA
ncbi:MAG: universal stress protein [Ginsengibacter sp.]